MLPAEKLEPGDTISIVGPIVVAFNGNRRNAGIFEFLQATLRLHQRHRINGALIEEIPRDQETIGPSGDGGIDHREKRAGKVVESLLDAVLLITQMIVR